MSTKIQSIESDGDVLVRVAGDVDLSTSPDLRKVLLKDIPSKGKTLAIDLSEVPYMDSSGVATMVEGLKKCMAKGASFVLVSPSGAVLKVLQLARLDTVFEIRDTAKG